MPTRGGGWAPDRFPSPMHLRTRPVATVLAAVALLAGCTSSPDALEPDPEPGAELTSVGWTPESAGELEDGGTLRLAVPVLPTTFNPLASTGPDPVRNGTLDQVLEPTTGSAVRVTADGGWEVDPDYARAVEVVETSPLTVRVDLNPEAVWSDGTPITAADMVATWTALNGSDDDFEVRSTAGWSDVDEVTADDDGLGYSVVFDRVRSDWPQYVYPSLPASVASSAERFNDGFDDRAVPSNGPFAITEIDRDAGRVVAERNPSWWGDPPRLDAVTWQAATIGVQLEALADGDLDAIEAPSPARLDEADLSGDDVRMLRSLGTEWTHLTMNGGSGPLRDASVRRALALALDRGELAEVVLGSDILLPGQRGYRDQSDLIATDRDESRRLLAEAGYTADDPLTLTMPVPATTSTSTERATAIAEQLSEVGVEVQLERVPDEDFFATRVIPLDFDLVTFTHSGSAFPLVDAKALFHPIDSPQNVTGTEDDDLGEAWDEAIATLDEERRLDLVADLDERLLTEVPLVPLGVVPVEMVVSTAVVNYGPAQFLRPDWTAVGLR